MEILTITFGAIFGWYISSKYEDNILLKKEQNLILSNIEKKLI